MTPSLDASRPVRPAPRRALLALSAGLALGLSGCAGAAPAADEAITVQDCGEQLTLPAAPQRVFTIGTAAVELLDAAGAADRIVARAGEFGAPLPEGLRQPPPEELVVDPADPATEQIIASGADAVLGYGLFSADAEELQAAGIALLTVQAECGHDARGQGGGVTPQTVIDDVRRLGAVFGTSAVAEPAADELAARAEAAGRAPDGRSAAWVYYFSSEDPLAAYGAGGLGGGLLASAGLENAYGEQAESYLTISVESLLERQPEWIVLGYGLYGESEQEARRHFLAEPGVEALTAVQRDRIVMMPAELSHPGPSAVAGLERLSAAVGVGG